MHGVKSKLEGLRFARMRVLSFSHSNKHQQRCFICQCDCGKIKTVPGGDLLSGRIQSCGCLAKERVSEAASGEKNFNYIHGGSGTKLHRLWRGMHERCSGPKHISFPFYGKKGIGVCPAWRTFGVFREWAERNGYKPGLSIDRKKTEKNYSPENCEWITRSENTARGNKNRRSK